MSIKQNIEAIRENISNAANKTGTKVSDIIIVCVSKNRTREEIHQVLDAGITHIGESKVQEAQDKIADLTEYAKKINLSFNFHMVGHLQTNKVNKAVDIFDMIQSVDSQKLAQKINEAARERGIKKDILIEVNTSQEESKFGATEDAVLNLIKELAELNNICVRGLMTMAPAVKDEEETRPYFRRLRQLRDQINKINEPLFKEKIRMDLLSMGMSQDYEIAIEEGANMLRIGTAIFGGGR
ncbi:MAG: YggS family pyridoxal phosphate-dependent enzyme [Candidatus Omnitrophica bacterium]|nr:YggS family pyridoxal phosphate-dependent enzyme [Candidatus Omnitrophota bacterium]MDD5550382.1 YggS family pyridoxal phosphate-dependent enzyme [Candidatus Omnitrophota bacterium]